MKSVVVCGSKKYREEIAAFCAELEKLGVLVFAPNFPSAEDIVAESDTFHSAFITSTVFKGLTLEHFDWIRKAEVCYVYNKNGYVGASVTMEMAYASALAKPVFALELTTGDSCRDTLIDKVIATPKKLAQIL